MGIWEKVRKWGAGAFNFFRCRSGSVAVIYCCMGQREGFHGQGVVVTAFVAVASMPVP